MNFIPAGIEASLLEAGFSATEVAIIRRLLENDALSLRGLASASGKSTGVLDQATKKLLQKNIIRKETINGTEKFTITSLDFVLRWMEDDSKHKRELMVRRQQTFESFLRSVEHQKNRPEIEYFDGIDGLAKAYRKLLDCGKEMIGYVPVFCSIEDHPLRDFMVEWFRQRRKKGVFSRIITHNTPLGRRYLSRDLFEYRKSLLVEEDQLPFTFEKIICGDTVVFFNYTEKRACMLRYPEMASMERAMFESWWKRLEHKDPVQPAQKPVVGAAMAMDAVSVIKPGPIVVPLSTRTLSGLREFFLSRASIAAFCAIAVLSAGITFGLYQYTKNLQFDRMKETVKSIAATAAFQFDAKDLDALQVESDWKKPEWMKVVKQQERIRMNNDDITFVYIFRKTKNDPTKMEFISDSHSINPYANLDSVTTNDVDADNDGIVDPQGHDKLQWPGQPYPDPDPAIFLAYEKPTTTDHMIDDSFGKVVSGFAPIGDANGRTAGVIGVDMKATVLQQRTTDVFQPALYFLGFFFLFVLIRLTAFNRSLFMELWKVLNMRKVLVTALLCAELALAITFGLYRYMLDQT
ncbi:hypothetical protein EXS70_01425, partial [Candidatus Peribacteria bacterium]|nr:hypothetical protein [Candidatus Peribacteria bacterium]